MLADNSVPEPDTNTVQFDATGRMIRSDVFEDREEKPQQNNASKDSNESTKDIKNQGYCISVSNSLRDVQAKIRELSGKTLSSESKIKRKKQKIDDINIDDINKEIIDIGVLDIIDPRKSKAKFGGPALAADVVITGMKVKKKSKLKEQVSILKNEISRLQGKIKRFDAQINEAHKKEGNIAQELRLNCPNFNR